MASRLAHVRKAVRPALKGRMMVSGPPGSGKTRSALMVAEPLAEGGRILVIDTEKESALTYADDFTFEHLPWAAPYDPRELTATLAEAGREFDAIIIDSLTHFWKGSGGTLDIANGRFTGWKEARPAQEDLVEAILTTDAHVIVCVRSKMKHEQVEEGGRHKVHKLGMGPVQDEDLEYEVNVSVSIDMGHTISIAKSRTTALPVGREFKPGHATDLAVLYRDWLKGGEPPASRTVIDALVERMNALPDKARAAAKQEFVATIGRPDHLTEAQVPDAEALVARHENAGGADPTPTPPASGDGSPPVATDPEGGNRPASTPTDAPGPSGSVVLSKRNIAMRAAEAFQQVGEAAPPKHKTRWLARMRHALVFVESGGDATSANDLDAEQLAAVYRSLGQIIDGQVTYEYDMADDRGVTFVTAAGQRTTVLWADLEPEAVPA